MNLFRELNSAGSTIILITHDPELASQASRVVYIDDGHLSSAVAATLPEEKNVVIQGNNQPPQQGISS
jgi:putative ABC transport system ATP-binding protein